MFDGKKSNVRVGREILVLFLFGSSDLSYATTFYAIRRERKWDRRTLLAVQELFPRQKQTEPRPSRLSLHLLESGVLRDRPRGEDTTRGTPAERDHER